MSAHPKLVEIVRQWRAGFPDDQIRKTLIEQGVPAADVDEAFDLSGPKPGPSTLPADAGQAVGGGAIQTMRSVLGSFTRRSAFFAALGVLDIGLSLAWHPFMFGQFLFGILMGLSWFGYKRCAADIGWLYAGYSLSVPLYGCLIMIWKSAPAAAGLRTMFGLGIALLIPAVVLGLPQIIIGAALGRLSSGIARHATPPRAKSSLTAPL